MDTTFNAIGFDVTTDAALAALAADVDARGESTTLERGNGGILHGRCLKVGAGLEVWMDFYESRGEVLRTNCRPAFRARRSYSVSPWILTESEDGSTSVIHGFLDDSNVEVLFQLQNRTEVAASMLEARAIEVGLCGLAHRAKVTARKVAPRWVSYDETALNIDARENDWGIAGEIVALESVRNPRSAAELFWMRVDAGDFELEMIVNRGVLRGRPRVGAFIEAEVWLQGHIVTPVARRRYEGLDRSVGQAELWQRFRRRN